MGLNSVDRSRNDDTVGVDESSITSTMNDNWHAIN